MSFSRSSRVAAVLVVGLGAFAGAVWGRGGESKPVEALGSPADCSKYSGLPAGLREDEHAGMVRIDGGMYVPGSRHGYAEERPAGVARVDPFWLDRTEVTNAQFAAFVAATGYITEAEKRGGGGVFQVPSADALAQGPGAWWRYVPGASWQDPDGSGKKPRPHEPVVQLTLADALRYADWLGRRLPTEIEWEFAARGGLDEASLHRAPKDSRDRPTANFWQGDFPTVNRSEDGFAGRAPVGCFVSNPFGLFDVIGNVWEWTSDDYRGQHQAHGTGAPRLAEIKATRERVIKGGSYLCASNFCARYRATARHAQDEHLPTVHVGFRTAKSI